MGVVGLWFIAGWDSMPGRLQGRQPLANEGSDYTKKKKLIEQ